MSIITYYACLRRCLTCTLHLGAQQGRTVRYVGRPAAASPATASVAIHRKETADIVDAALAS